MLFGGPAGNLSPPIIFTDKTIFMILFHLPWLGAQLHIPFFEFLNNKHLRSKWIFFLQKISFLTFFFCVACFYWKEIKYLKNGMWRSRQLNFLQNDARFSLLCQKLWEEIHLELWKVYFSGGEKNTSKYNKM